MTRDSVARQAIHRKKKDRSHREKAAASRVRHEPRPNAAGIDLASEVHYVAVPEDRDPQPVRNFGTMTGDLHALADWLSACGVETALRMAAQSYNRSDSAMGDYFRRMRAKLGQKGATVAAAHKLARILYAMVKHRQPYNPDRFGNPKLLRLKKEHSLRKQAEKLGYKLVPAVS